MNATNLLSHGVYLIGAKDETKDNFMTAAWAAQAASNAVMVAVGKNHYTAQIISRTGHFSLSVLAEDQVDIARRCGTVSGRQEDKTKNMPVDRSKDGDPILKTALASLACRTVHSFDALDHIIFIAEITASRLMKAGTPLLFQKYNEYFSRHPAGEADQSGTET